MIYSYITEQWNILRNTATALQENINEALDSESFNNEQEEQDLRNMRIACNKVIAALHGYID